MESLTANELLLLQAPFHRWAIKTIKNLLRRIKTKDGRQQTKFGVWLIYTVQPPNKHIEKIGEGPHLLLLLRRFIKINKKKKMKKKKMKMNGVIE